MKAILRQIALDTGKKLFAIGDTVEANEEHGVTAELVADLIERGVAELASGEGEGLPPELDAAIGGFRAAFAGVTTAVGRVLDVAEAGPAGAARAALEALRTLDGLDGQDELKQRIFALMDRANAEDEAAHQAAHQTPESVSPVAEGEAGASKPASEGGPVDGQAPPEITAGDAGPTDAPPPTGVDGDAGASAPAEPAPQADAKAKKPARKGGAKGD